MIETELEVSRMPDMDQVSKKIMDDLSVEVFGVCKKLADRIKNNTAGKVKPEAIKKSDTEFSVSVLNPTELKDAKRLRVVEKAWAMLPSMLGDIDANL